MKQVPAAQRESLTDNRVTGTNFPPRNVGLRAGCVPLFETRAPFGALRKDVRLVAARVSDFVHKAEL